MIKGIINWYDKESGHGCIVSDDTVYYRIHEFTDINIELEPKMAVVFELANSSIHPIVMKVKGII